MSWPSWRRYLLRTIALLGVVVICFVGWNAWRIWQAWRSVERVSFDVGSSREALEQLTPGFAAPDPVTALDDLLDAFLVVGSDAKPEAAGERADVIMLFLRPTDGATPILMSIPRDLEVVSPCSGEMVRINTNLDGCGTEVGGPELMAVSVEALTGVPIDHFVLFGLDGFEKVIDRVGGVEICVPRALQHDFKDLLPAGCSVADGATTLLWLRSRTTFELIDGEWVPLTDNGDLARNERQQQVLLELLGKLDDFRSPTAFSRLVEDLSDTFVLDDGLSLSDAVGYAWDLRGLDPNAIKRPRLPVEPGVNDAGGFVLNLAEPFGELLAKLYPPAAAHVVDAADSA